MFSGKRVNLTPKKKGLEISTLPFCIFRRDKR